MAQGRRVVRTAGSEHQPHDGDLCALTAPRRDSHPVSKPLALGMMARSKSK